MSLRFNYLHGIQNLAVVEYESLRTCASYIIGVLFLLEGTVLVAIDEILAVHFLLALERAAGGLAVELRLYAGADSDHIAYLKVGEQDHIVRIVTNETKTEVEYVFVRGIVLMQGNLFVRPEIEVSRSLYCGELIELLAAVLRAVFRSILCGEVTRSERLRGTLLQISYRQFEETDVCFDCLSLDCHGGYYSGDDHRNLSHVIKFVLLISARLFNHGAKIHQFRAYLRTYLYKKV